MAYLINPVSGSYFGVPTLIQENSPIQNTILNSFSVLQISNNIIINGTFTCDASAGGTGGLLIDFTFLPLNFFDIATNLFCNVLAVEGSINAPIPINITVVGSGGGNQLLLNINTLASFPTTTINIQFALS